MEDFAISAFFVLLITICTFVVIIICLIFLDMFRPILSRQELNFFLKGIFKKSVIKEYVPTSISIIIPPNYLPRGLISNPQASDELRKYKPEINNDLGNIKKESQSGIYSDNINNWMNKNNIKYDPDSFTNF